MEILCFFLQLFREQMEISAISCQMRLFFIVSLKFIREEMEIWSEMLTVETNIDRNKMICGRTLLKGRAHSLPGRSAEHQYR